MTRVVPSNHTTHKQHTQKMVYDKKTLKPCHKLTKEGEQAYRLMLELKADEILFKAKHPIKYWLQRIKNFIKYGDSTWDGAHYPEEKKYQDGFSYTR